MNLYKRLETKEKTPVKGVLHLMATPAGLFATLIPKGTAFGIYYAIAP